MPKNEEIKMAKQQNKSDKSNKPKSQISVTKREEVVSTSIRHLEIFDYVIEGEKSEVLAGVLVEVIYDEVSEQYPEFHDYKEVVHFRVDGERWETMMLMQFEIQKVLRKYLTGWKPNEIDDKAEKIKNQIEHYLMANGIKYQE